MSKRRVRGRATHPARTRNQPTCRGPRTPYRPTAPRLAGHPSSGTQARSRVLPLPHLTQHACRPRPTVRRPPHEQLRKVCAPPATQPSRPGRGTPDGQAPPVGDPPRTTPASSSGKIANRRVPIRRDGHARRVVTGRYWPPPPGEVPHQPRQRRTALYSEPDRVRVYRVGVTGCGVPVRGARLPRSCPATPIVDAQ